jgi:hypothetical protein
MLPETNIGRYVTHGKEALLLKRGNSLEIADHLMNIFRNSAKAAKLGVNALKFAEEHFRWSRAVSTLSDFYAGVLPVRFSACAGNDSLKSRPGGARALHTSQPEIRENKETRPLVLFLHMPKCAGTSIRFQLENSNGAVRVFPFYPDGLSEQEMRDICRTHETGSDVFFGHFAYGLHNYFTRPTRYVTVLRDPYDYLVSQYFFRKYTLKEKEFLACETIFEAMQRYSNFFDNTFTRYLAGLSAQSVLDEGTIKKACKAMDEHFDFIGFSENMADVCDRLSRYFGLPIENIRRNKTPESGERAGLDMEDFRNAAFEYVKYDLEVLRHAKEHIPRI